MCQRELNQKQLAKESGLSPTTVTAAMHKKSVKIVTVGKLARAFECEPSELVII